MNYLARCTVALFFLFFAIFAYAADDCDAILGEMDRQINHPAKVQPIDLGMAELESYTKSKIIGDFQVGQIDNEVLMKIMDRADQCALEKQPYYLKNENYHFTDEQKNILINNIVSAQKIFPFINAMQEEMVTPSGISVSCLSLSKYTSSAYRGSIRLPSQLFGKDIFNFKNEDFKAIIGRIDQCESILEGKVDGFLIPQSYKNSLDVLKEELPSISSLQNAAWGERKVRDDEIKKAAIRKQKEENPSVFVSILRGLEKLNGAGGGIFILVGVAGLAKIDKRFKTGRKNNKPDARWAMPLMAIGSAMLVLAWIVGKVADFFQFS